MKKLIALFAFLCLAVGTTGAKGSLDNPEGSYAKIDTRKLEYPIPYIPVEKRAAILPKHNICSIAPAGPRSCSMSRNGRKLPCPRTCALTCPASANCCWRASRMRLTLWWTKPRRRPASKSI